MSDDKAVLEIRREDGIIQTKTGINPVEAGISDLEVKQIQELRNSDNTQQDYTHLRIGFGQIGYYNPNFYLRLICEHCRVGGIWRDVFPIGVLAAGFGILSYVTDVTVDITAHQLLGTVLGFLLVVMNNMSVGNHEKAITLLNNMVQQGIGICTEVLPGIQGNDHFACAEREDFRRLVVLYFRLACYEVRADMQAQEKRNTWLDPDGGVCSNEERNMFQLLMARTAEYTEWSWEHPALTNEECDRGFFTVPTGIHKRTGAFSVPMRPAVVSTWLVQKLHAYYEERYIPSAPVHARLMSQLSEFTNNLAVMLAIDRTPLPFPYVQMAASLMLVFCLSLPFALTPIFGIGSPMVALVFAMAYGGLYINACNLRNPFNYETGITGAPINAYIQRLEVVTEGLLFAVNGEYEEAPEASGRRRFPEGHRRNDASNVEFSEINLEEMSRPLTQWAPVAQGPGRHASVESSLYTSRDTEFSLDEDSCATSTRFPMHGLLRRANTTPAPAPKMQRTDSLESAVSEDDSEARATHRRAAASTAREGTPVHAEGPRQVRPTHGSRTPPAAGWRPREHGSGPGKEAREVQATRARSGSRTPPASWRPRDSDRVEEEEARPQHAPLTTRNRSSVSLR